MILFVGRNFYERQSYFNTSFVWIKDKKFFIKNMEVHYTNSSYIDGKKYKYVVESTLGEDMASLAKLKDFHKIYVNDEDLERIISHFSGGRDVNHWLNDFLWVTRVLRAIIVENYDMLIKKVYTFKFITVRENEL